MTPSKKDQDDDEAAPRQFSSPPCMLHELDPERDGRVVDLHQARDVARWRKVERERLIAARLALSAGERTADAIRIARDLDVTLSPNPSSIVSVYWPFRGEPDLRPWMMAISERGVRVALPVVIAPSRPLVFREWRPGARLERGVWNIPFPADGAIVAPTIVIAPLVGYDCRATIKVRSVLPH